MCIASRFHALSFQPNTTYSPPRWHKALDPPLRQASHERLDVRVVVDSNAKELQVVSSRRAGRRAGAGLSLFVLNQKYIIYKRRTVEFDWTRFELDYHYCYSRTRASRHTDRQTERNKRRRGADSKNSKANLFLYLHSTDRHSPPPRRPGCHWH